MANYPPLEKVTSTPLGRSTIAALLCIGGVERNPGPPPPPQATPELLLEALRTLLQAPQTTNQVPSEPPRARGDKHPRDRSPYDRSPRDRTPRNRSPRREQDSRNRSRREDGRNPTRNSTPPRTRIPEGQSSAFRADGRPRLATIWSESFADLNEASKRAPQTIPQLLRKLRDSLNHNSCAYECVANAYDSTDCASGRPSIATCLAAFDRIPSSAPTGTIADKQSSRNPTRGDGRLPDGQSNPLRADGRPRLATVWNESFADLLEASRRAPQTIPQLLRKLRDSLFSTSCAYECVADAYDSVNIRGGRPSIDACLAAFDRIPKSAPTGTIADKQSSRNSTRADGRPTLATIWNDSYADLLEASKSAPKSIPQLLRNLRDSLNQNSCAYECVADAYDTTDCPSGRPSVSTCVSAFDRLPKSAPTGIIADKPSSRTRASTPPRTRIALGTIWSEALSDMTHVSHFTPQTIPELLRKLRTDLNHNGYPYARDCVNSALHAIPMLPSDAECLAAFATLPSTAPTPDRNPTRTTPPRLHRSSDAAEVLDTAPLQLVSHTPLDLPTHTPSDPLKELAEVRAALATERASHEAAIARLTAQHKEEIAELNRKLHKHDNGAQPTDAEVAPVNNGEKPSDSSFYSQY